MNIYAWSSLITLIISFFLGLVVYLKKPTLFIAKIWFLLSLSISIWSLGLLITFITINKSVALQWLGIAHSATLLIATFFLHFVLALLNTHKNNKIKIWLIISYILSAVVIFLIFLFPRSFIKDATSKLNFRYYTEAGQLYYIYIILWFLTIFFAVIYLSTKLKGITDKIDHKRARNILFASIVGFSGGATFFPLVFNNLFPPIGLMAVPVYSIIIAYAILKYQLLDIEVIVKSGVVYLSLIACSIFIFTFLIIKGMNIYGAAAIFTSIINFSLGLFVYFRDKNNNINKTWWLFSLSITVWSLGYGLMLISDIKNIALMWAKISHLGAVFIPILLLHFVSLRQNVFWEQKKKIVLGYFLSSILSIFILTPYFIKDVTPKINVGYYFVPGYVYYLFTGVFFTYTIFGFLVMLNAYRKLSGIALNQVKYELIASVFGFGGGATTFPLVFGIPLYPFGVLSFALYPIIITYSIIRYHLMDINLALTRAGIFAVVYTLVLGIPLGFTGWGKLWLQNLLGVNWYWAPVILAIMFATAGPFIFMLVLRRAESRLLAEKHRRQKKLRELSSYMMRFTRLSTLAGLIVHNVLKILQLRHVALYLLEADNNKPKQYNLITSYAVPCRDDLPKNIAFDSVLAKALTQQKVFIEREEIKHKAASTINHNLSFLEQELTQLKASIIIPAFLRSNLMGFLILGESKTNETFTQEDINVLQVLSNQAALAIENALFWQRDEEKLVESSKEEAASAVSFGAGHQFNNRLYAMSMMVDGIFDALGERDIEQMTQEEIRPLFKKTLGKLKKISEECQFGGQITAGIMSLTGTTPPNFEEFDISVIINSSIELVEMKHSRDKIEGNRPPVLIINRASNSLPLIFGSDAQIRDCFFNLIDNAYDAAYEKDIKIKKEDPALHWPKGQVYNPQIEVKASVKDNYLVIDITDNGIGVQEEDKKRIFVGFFTTKATSVKGYGPGGHGIGVFTVKKLILAHKGKISFNSEYGKGTTFTIELPLLKKGNNSHA